MDQTAVNARLAAAPKATTPASNSTDDELVAATRNGDEEAFELLFERHRRLVARLAYRFFYQREQVEEIVQESFAKAYFALGTYKGGHEKSFAAWLSRITVFTCYSELRRPRWRVERVESDLSEGDAAILARQLNGTRAKSDVENVAISRDLASKLLNRLKPDDRMALTLLDVAGLSEAEAAELLGWSVPKLKMRVFRARSALRRVLHKFL
jgi:RNA polymerase sigma-70 factor (ECF subfamily)